MTNALPLSEHYGKILLAVDLDSEISQSKNTMHSLHFLMKHLGCTAEPVNTLSLCRDQSQLEANYQKAQLALYQFLKSQSGAGISRAQVLIPHQLSRQSSASALAEYASKSQASLILVNSHAYKGFDRILLGSFADGLIAESPVPVLVLNRDQSVQRLNKIVFATDFTPGSLKVFYNLLSMASAFNSQILLFHKMMSKELKTAAARDLLSISKEHDPNTSEIERWVQIGAHHGINVTYHSSPCHQGIADCIIHEAKTWQADMIALAANTSPVASQIEGKITRQILSQSALPVWIQKS